MSNQPAATDSQKTIHIHSPAKTPYELEILELKRSGQLGVFYDRENTSRIPTLINVDFDRLHNAVQSVMRSVLIKQTHLLKDQIVDLANDLANGVCVMTHCKLRAVNLFDWRIDGHFRRKPKVKATFEVPPAYALAISKLGQVRISGMTRQFYVSPSAPAGACNSFGCPVNRPSDPFAYSRSVELAKKLGVEYTGVDLTEKMGSSWWLYHPVADADGFRLECPYPEENFTEESAALAALFATTTEGGFYNPIIELPPLGTQLYGTMLRSPPIDIAVDVYYAVVPSPVEKGQ